MVKPWKTLSSKLAFDHPWFKVQQDVVELPNGQVIDDYMMWKCNEVALIVPVTSDGLFVMVHQYKHAVDDFMTEFPAGYVEDSEHIELAAQRELLEETGYQAPQLEFLGKLVNNPTKEMGKVHVYLARNARKVAEQQLDVTEAIEVQLHTMEEVENLIATHQIVTSGSIAAFTLAKKRLDL